MIPIKDNIIILRMFNEFNLGLKRIKRLLKEGEFVKRH